MSALVRYEEMRLAVERCARIDEAAEIKDKAAALQAYARQRDDVDLEIWTSEIRLRASVRIGELVRELDKSAGGSNPAATLPAGGKSKQKTIAEAGLSRTQAYRYQELAGPREANLQSAGKAAAEKYFAEARATKTPATEAGLRSAVTEAVHAALGPQEIARRAAAERSARAAERRAENEALKATPVLAPTEGRFGTIVIDPPWDMQKIEREVRPNQVAFDYPTMSEAELAAFPVADMAADDCQLFVWTTQKFLPAALRLVDAWAFRYVLTMVWHKPGGFQPIGLPQYNCEFVIYGRRGTPEFRDTKAFPTCFNAPRREHSRKPDEFYDLIRRVTSEGRIDIFSREARDGFAQYGNETEKFTST